MIVSLAPFLTLVCTLLLCKERYRLPRRGHDIIGAILIAMLG
jgi:hypothetical protein